MGCRSNGSSELWAVGVMGRRSYGPSELWAVGVKTRTHLVDWLCCVDRPAPEAIHNQVAIKLLMSGLLTWRRAYMLSNIKQVLYLYLFWFRDSCLSFYHQ